MGSKASMDQEIVPNISNQHVNMIDVSKFKVISYNCKNMETASKAFEHLAEVADVILVQEH